MSLVLRISSLIFSLLVANSAYASCIVNGVSYRTNSDTSGTYITLTNFTDRAGSWNNTTDLVTTCDVSQFTSMYRAFFKNSSFNQDISAWDVSNVTNMYEMFSRASSFNQDISAWDVSNVTNMNYMLYGTSFNQDISAWDVSNVTDMRGMFYSTSFNQDISAWDVSNVTNMYEMFGRTSSFNQDISRWDVSHVTNMGGMFFMATSFNQDISRWDVSNVTDMRYMFAAADSFNQDIRRWEVSDSTDMENMFIYADAMISTYGSDAGFGATPEVSWFTEDSTVPTLSSVSIASNNSTTTEGFAGDEVALTFTADETITTPTVTFKSGGDAVTDTSITYANTSGTTWSATYTVSVSDTAGAVTYSIAFSDSAGNAGTAVTTGSGSVTISPTPAVAFAAQLTDINAKIASFAQSELNNLNMTMRGISRSARSRFIAQMHGSKVKVSSNDPDYSGDLKATENSINSNLSFTKSSKSPTSLYASYTSGDIYINRLEDGSQSSGAASEILWERMVGDKTMLGYFFGGSLGLSNDPGTLSSYMRAISAKFGTYFVQEIEGDLIFDGYASLIATRNDLRFSTATMTAIGNYVTQGQSVGLNLTGFVPFGSLEIRPTGSFSLTRSFGQTVNFDVAVGSSTSTETATHGSISQADLSFAPEVRIPLDIKDSTIGDGSVATLTPKVTCQQLSKTTTTRHCGQGLALGIKTISNGGLTTINAQTSFDHMNGQTTAGIKLNLITEW